MKNVNTDKKAYPEGDIIELSAEEAKLLIDDGAALQEYHESRLQPVQIKTADLAKYIRNCGKSGSAIITDTGSICSSFDSFSNDIESKLVHVNFNSTDLLDCTTDEQFYARIPDFVSRLKDLITRTGRVKGFRMSFT